MSDVERFWNAIIKKWPHPVPEFNRLHPMQQMTVIQAINMILGVLDEQ